MAKEVYWEELRSNMLDWAKNPISSEAIHEELTKQDIVLHAQYNLINSLFQDGRLIVVQRPLGTPYYLAASSNE